MISETASSEPPQYNTKVIKQFAIMTVVWGIVGMLVGVIIAAQLVWPELKRWALSAFWSSETIAYQCGHFRLWWQRIICLQLPCGTAHL